MVIGIYIVVAGNMVLEEDLTLGAFVVTVDMYYRISQSWQNVYEVILTVHACLPALELIFLHMNLPIDLSQRRESMETCVRLGAEERIAARQKQKEPGVLYAIDMLPIKMRNVGYHYPQYDSAVNTTEVAVAKAKDTFVTVPQNRAVNHAGIAQEDFRGIKNINLEIAQGSLVALIGRRNEGKTTLLRVLGGVLVPTGDFYMPTHLRVVHVSQQPLFFQSTLLENLRYGIGAHHQNDDGKLSRVMDICKKMMVSDEVMAMVLDEGQHNWEATLSLTQRMSLHLARALIANSTVLVMHKPTLVFDNNLGYNILRTLREFVEGRGLEVEGDISLRRRRTCIFTNTKIEGCELADKVFWVNKEGVDVVDINQVDDAMLSISRDF